MDKEREKFIRRLAKDEVYLALSVYFMNEASKQEKKFLWYLRPTSKIIRKYWRKILDDWQDNIIKD